MTVRPSCLVSLFPARSIGRAEFWRRALPLVAVIVVLIWAAHRAGFEVAAPLPNGQAGVTWAIWAFWLPLLPLTLARLRDASVPRLMRGVLAAALLAPPLLPWLATLVAGGPDLPATRQLADSATGPAELLPLFPTIAVTGMIELVISAFEFMFLMLVVSAVALVVHLWILILLLRPSAPRHPTLPDDLATTPSYLEVNP